MVVATAVLNAPPGIPGPIEGIHPQTPLGAPMPLAIEPLPPFYPQPSSADPALSQSSRLPADASNSAPLQAPATAMPNHGVAVPAPDFAGDVAAAPHSAFFLAPQVTPFTAVVGPASAATYDKDPTVTQAATSAAPLSPGLTAFSAAPVPAVAPAVLPAASSPTFLSFATATAPAPAPLLLAAPEELLPAVSPIAGIAALPVVAPIPALSMTTVGPNLAPAVAAVSLLPQQIAPQAYAVPPIIRLVGPSPVVLQLGETYVDQGAVSNDADGMLWSNITHHIMGEFLLDGVS